MINDLKQQLQEARVNANYIEEMYVECMRELQDRIDLITADWYLANDKLLQDRVNALTLRDTLDAQLRSAAILHYNETGEKQFDSEVSVRVTKTLEYDGKTALDWAVKHEMCLALDKAAFKNVATATPLDFVSESETVVPVLAKEFKL